MLAVPGHRTGGPQRARDGAASGIAKAIALRLGERAVVGALDRDETGAVQTVAEIAGAGGALAYSADITDGRRSARGGRVRATRARSAGS
jgi:NAD(P)-dependent dehydrogenase (short-subunit alcohol dehydrogenase family)